MPKGSVAVNRRRPLVHIGYHKTGTTWLQERVFKVAKAGFRSPWTPMEIAEGLILPNDLDFNFNMARKTFESGVTSPSGSGLIPVLTWERLSGTAHAGGFDSATIAQRLHGVFPEARILIVVREQRSMIYALYQQYVRDGGIATLDGYLRPRHEWEIPQFRFEHLEYDRLARLYRKLFGSDRVLVLAFEELRVNPNGFAARIVAYAQAPSTVDPVTVSAENTSFNPATVGLRRFPGHLWKPDNGLGGEAWGHDGGTVASSRLRQ